MRLGLNVAGRLCWLTAAVLMFGLLLYMILRI
jgi:hypothetical protein